MDKTTKHAAIAPYLDAASAHEAAASQHREVAEYLSAHQSDVAHSYVLKALELSSKAHERAVHAHAHFLSLGSSGPGR